MNERRKAKLKSALTTEVAAYYSRLDGGILSITSVELSPDLREAVIWYSTFNEAPTVTEARLTAEIRALSQYLRKRLDLKYIPKFRFARDQGLVHQSNIEQQFKKA